MSRDGVPAAPWLYRAGVALCPPAFRAAYGDQMLRDWEDARADAGDGAPWRFRARMTFDLVRTIAVQWGRSGLPVIALIAVSIPLMVVHAIVTWLTRLKIDPPPERADSDVLALVLMATLVVMFIAATMVLTLWSGRLVRRPRRSPCCRRAD